MNKSIFKSLAPNLMVKNVEESIEFYEKILGFHTVMSVPEKASFDWAMIRKDDVIIMLQKKECLLKELPHLEKQKIGGTLSIYIEITNIKRFYEQVKTKIEILEPLHKTFYGKEEFIIKDCNGYILVFASDCDADSCCSCNC